MTLKNFTPVFLIFTGLAEEFIKLSTITKPANDMRMADSEIFTHNALSKYLRPWHALIGRKPCLIQPTRSVSRVLRCDKKRSAFLECPGCFITVQYGA